MALQTALVTTLIPQWAAAERQGDVAGLESLLAADFHGVGPRGFVLTRDQWIDRYRSGALKNSAFDISDVQTRAYGDISVAIGVQEQESSYRGHEVSGRFRITMIAAGNGDRPVLVGIQLSPMAPPS